MSNLDFITVFADKINKLVNIIYMKIVESHNNASPVHTLLLPNKQTENSVRRANKISGDCNNISGKGNNVQHLLDTCSHSFRSCIAHFIVSERSF